MTKVTVVTEKEEYHRVWNFVVPLSALGNKESIKSIPPLTKKSSIAHSVSKRKRKIKK